MHPTLPNWANLLFLAGDILCVSAAAAAVLYVVFPEKVVAIRRRWSQLRQMMACPCKHKKR